MADENLHAKHRARMQERVERDGLDSLAEHEALEYLLFLSIPRADTNALAHRLIQHFGDFCKVLEAEPEELMQVEGVGPKSARLISTVMACSRYYELKKRKTRLSLNSAETAIAYVKPLFRGVQNEQLYLILLDDACRPVQDLRIAEGVPNRVAVDTRKLLRAVARTNSTCGILAHNHPTGAGHSVRGGPPDDIPYYGGHRPARLYDHGSYHHSGGGWLFDAEPRQPAGIPRKQRRAAGCQPLNAAHAPCRVPAGRIFLWFGYKISANLFTLKICRAIIIIQLIVVHERNDYGRSLSLKGTVSAHRRPAAGDRSADAGHP